MKRKFIKFEELHESDKKYLKENLKFQQKYDTGDTMGFILTDEQYKNDTNYFDAITAVTNTILSKAMKKKIYAVPLYQVDELVFTNEPEKIQVIEKETILEFINNLSFKIELSYHEKQKLNEYNNIMTFNYDSMNPNDKENRENFRIYVINEIKRTILDKNYHNSEIPKLINHYGFTENDLMQYEQK